MLRPRGIAVTTALTEEWGGCPDPVGISEIAERHGTTPGTIRSWRHRHADFPEPIADLAMGPLFDWHAVEAWLKTRR